MCPKSNVIVFFLFSCVIYKYFAWLGVRCYRFKVQDLSCLRSVFFKQWNTTPGVGVERTPDPDTSGNRCEKPDPRYPTRLSVKVLISGIEVFFHINCAIFFMSTVFMAPEICCPINQLATTRHIPLNEAKNIEEFSNSHRVNLTRSQSWSKLTYPIPDPTQIFSVRSTPFPEGINFRMNLLLWQESTLFSTRFAFLPKFVLSF